MRYLSFIQMWSYLSVLMGQSTENGERKESSSLLMKFKRPSKKEAKFSYLFLLWEELRNFLCWLKTFGSNLTGTILFILQAKCLKKFIRISSSINRGWMTTYRIRLRDLDQVLLTLPTLKSTISSIRTCLCQCWSWPLQECFMVEQHWRSSKHGVRILRTR